MSRDKYDTSSSPSTGHHFEDVFSESNEDSADPFLLDLPTRFSATSSNTLEYTEQPTHTHLRGADLSLAASSGSIPTRNSETKEFLSYERRGLWGQAAYNVGYSYGSGCVTGYCQNFHKLSMLTYSYISSPTILTSLKFGERMSIYAASPNRHPCWEE
jgi:hypothetical protein